MVRPPGRSAASRRGGALDLQSSRLSVAYRQRLNRAGSVLEQWARERGFSLATLEQDPQKMNDVLIRFLQELFELGAAVWVGTHAVLAVQTRWRGLKGLLRPAWDSIGSWRLQSPIRSRTPLPLCLLTLFCRFAVYSAVVAEPHDAAAWWGFGVVLRLAFRGLLRPKEAWNLVRRDVRLPGRLSLLGAPVGVLTIRDTKNRAHMGRLQVRAIRCPEALAWLRWWTVDFSDGSMVWPFGGLKFRQLFSKAVAFFGLEALRLSPASCRAGGATALFESGEPISSIRFAGSWASERVLSHYLQEAESAAALLSINESQASRIEKFLGEFAFAADPPQAVARETFTWTSTRLPTPFVPRTTSSYRRPAAHGG